MSELNPVDNQKVDSINVDKSSPELKKHTFEAEVAQLLHLVTHSLYSNSDIFVRELVSNASDACDKLRFEATNDDSLYEDDGELKIRIAVDEDAKTITFTDNGIGMNEADAIENLGTIAKSGTKAFLDKLSESQKQDGQLIGQFGVGFYSGFIVADTISVETRKAGEPADKGVRWVSDGTGSFTVEPITKETRGTAITLHLKEQYSEGEESYLDRGKIKQLVNKYSDHISLPIQMRKEVWQEDEVEEGSDTPANGQMVLTDEWETINKASALWTRSASEIEDEEYIDFYKNITYDMDAPLAWTHNRVEGRVQYTQLLYIPKKAPVDLYTREQQHGLKLYVKRVFIMDEAEQLLPMYLRFVKGVIDSADLPLNVSRELLQESRDVKSIRDGNARRILTLLASLANSEDSDKQEKFAQFYAEFGDVIKEGVGEDMGNQERIAKLLRYATSTQDSVTTSFEDYKARMKEGQKAIYYLTADNLAAAKNSPQLELFKKKGIEVILMTSRVDEWAMNFLTSFDETPLQNIAKGAVDLGDLQDEAEKAEAEKAQETMKPIVDKLKTALGERAKDVKVSTRLVDSPACLVVGEGELSPQMIQMLKQMGQDVPESKPTLEVNPDHPLIKKLESSEQSAEDFDKLAQVIFDQALLADGGQLDDPAAYLRRVNELLMR
ncbi:molecular chaperone HtpG [Psychrobacter cryohalolentis]|uniref:Chaperone protein HtpG n=1 Tax=Psychrobacter cryohalolentis (strain ATCC BAA-1226 / DSM 17306 / VKM B-2378 / K5) TaxID=335284 RepID=HTPG_PSYCK|nr:molecular chaperone HtpG [Psychrobacter cryohalolentis]Q1Q978.1 RecName: Full=Chaperone protein HtpG; AltName: Full=Heat shock protein HtpG; AltName: Full=High temperature protein G [Psychrobacter cryohalolentis K5]ABE75775.1 heat shock protein Hsp90 [Psychrobacter cryohalolentis K5]